MPEVRIGDYVWIDTNGDGAQGLPADEPGVPDVTVNLLDEVGAVVDTTLTDADGFYGFDVVPGTYTVEFIAPDGYYLASDWPTLQGRDAVAGYLEAAFALPQDTILGGPIHIDVAASGDLAYEVGQTDVRYNFASGDTTIKAHYIVVWKKLDGRWQAVATSVSGSR